MAEGKLTGCKAEVLASTFSNAAPAEDVTLTDRDTDAVLEELLPAQTQSYVLGMKLKLQLHEIEAIHVRYSEPRDRLLQIIIAFLRQAEPRPTWRVIVNALNSPVVNLTALARRVEAAHFPDPTATRDMVLETTGKPQATCTSHIINPRRACAARVTVVVLCVCPVHGSNLLVCVFRIMASFRR